MSTGRSNVSCYGLTGGGLGSLDSVLSTSLTNNGVAITLDSAKIYFHYWDSTSASAESSPDVIKPDNLGVGDAGRWLLIDVWTGLAALDAIGALTPAANKIPHFTSATAATALEITANTFPARSSAGNIAAKALTDAALTFLALTAAQGDVPYCSATNVISMLAKGAANTKKFMNAAGTLPEWASGIFLGSFTRDTAAASGDVAYTGVGFKPSVVLFFTAHSTVGSCAGFDNGTVHACIYARNDNGVAPYAFLLTDAAGANYQTAIVKTMDADGFTLTYVKSSSPTGTDTIYYLALR